MKLSHKLSTVSNVSGVLSKTKLVNIESNHFINDLTHPTHLTHNTHLKRTGFTLAEVLITLGIIGVVAAITMPTLITNITERANSERQANIAQKVTQAMERMRALGKLDGSYTSTEAFVDELEKYLKITKRCNYQNIAECWPTDSVKLQDGGTFEISNAKTGKSIGLKTTTNNVGLVLADGAAIILNYDNNSHGMDVSDPVKAFKMSLPVGGGKTKDFVYSSSAASSIDFIMDVNGSKKPNKSGENADVRSFNGASLDGACYEGGGGCIRLLASYENLDCTSIGSDSPLYKFCEPHESQLASDAWAGAKYACDKIGMKLPSASEMDGICANKTDYPFLEGLYPWVWTKDPGYLIDRATDYNISTCEPNPGYGRGGHIGTICIKDESNN